MKDMTAYILQTCLINILFVTHKVETGCQEFKSGIHVFGPSCGFMCHCVDGDKCHDVTGECTSGCAAEWAGPGCQYKDVAKGNLADISENFPNTLRADYANDGNVSTCTRLVNPLNKTEEKSWWRVWLPYNETIQGLSIITATANESLPNVDFNVYVEKVPEYNQSRDFISTSRELCYKQEQTYSSTVPKNILCSSPIHGNQLRIELQSSNSVLSICDLRVFGGRNMAFKKNVTLSSTLRDSQLVVDGVRTTNWQKCSATNSTRNMWMIIDLKTRVKIQAFQLNYSENARVFNYTLEVSDDSENWHFVYNDQNKSQPTTLVHLNADARFLRLYRHTYNTRDRLVACEIEVFGDCLANTCGWDCSKTCHCNRLTESDISYGNCSNGCKGRWTGHDGRCDTECDDSSYGLDCNSSCSGNCKHNTPCNVKNGYCDEGCAPGWIGEKCSNECPDGKYSYNCTEDCSGLCRNNSTCRKTDGHCVNGCVNGIRGEKCDLSCNDGTYGLNCSFNCSGHCYNNLVCNKTNGSCTSGCEQGWTGYTCNEKCQNQTYGLNCAFNCSGYCLNGNVCMHTNGSCMNGCEPGWAGYTCVNACDEGSWGENCQRRCFACHGEKCDRFSGRCYGLCKPGFKQTNYCDQDLQQSEVTKFVVEETNEAISHYISGVGIAVSCIIILTICGVVIRFFIRKLKQKLDSDQDVTVSYTNTVFAEAYETDHADNAYQSIMENNVCGAEAEMEHMDFVYQTIKGKTDVDRANENVYQKLDDILDRK